uniref:RFX-type winged-helix domain-containing protein n=1 Tax=Tetranychus urticae TaxID=32264 RepID=T1JUE2_TETUR
MSLPSSYSLSNEKVKQKIAHLINEINQFNDIEKLLLYIQLPSGSPSNDPLKHKGPGNPFGKKADVEVAQTYTWIQSHLEEDSTVSLPKHEVYDEYRCFCQSNSFEPLCVADFGKAMKHVFPRVKPRRLGQRGNSKYCYSGLRKRLTLPAPCLPDLSNTSTSLNNNVNNSNDDNNNGKVNGDDMRINKANSMEEDSSSDPSSTEEALGVDGSVRVNNDANFSTINDSTTNIYGKHTISPDIVQNAATRLILDWAEGILEQSFTNLQELGKYLINYDLVDKNSLQANYLHRYPVKRNSLNSSKSKRDGTQSSVQKKSHIKEIPGNSRRKGVDRNSKSISNNSTYNNVKNIHNSNSNNSNSNNSGFAISTSSSSTSQQQETTTTTPTVTLTRVNRRSRRLSVNGNGRSMDINGDCALGVNGDNNLKSTGHLNINVKKEVTQVDDCSNIDTYSNNDENKTGLPMLKNSTSQNKIPRSGTSHHIIVLPNNVQLTAATRSISRILTGDKSGSQSVPVSCLSSSSTPSTTTSFVSTSSSSSSLTTTSSSSSSCSTIKSTSLTSPPSLSTVTQKYKRIQPKPVSLSRSNSNVLESTFNYSTINEHTTLSSSTTNMNNVINSSQGRNNNLNSNNNSNNNNINDNNTNNLKSNENETLLITRRHSLASVPINGNELRSSELLMGNNGLTIGSLRRDKGNTGRGSGRGGSIKEERCLDKTQIKRHCDVSRDSDNVSCKKRFTSVEGCESTSPLSSSTLTLLTGSKSTLSNVKSTNNETGIILTLANGHSSEETNSSSTSLSPLPTTLGINTLASDDILLTTGLSVNNGLNEDANQSVKQQAKLNKNKSSTSSEMCIKLQELECDALNDDLNEQHGASSSSLMDSYEHCDPSTLSQLRRLLEKNLPNSKSNSNVGLTSLPSTIPSDIIAGNHSTNNGTNVIINNNNHVNHGHHLHQVNQPRNELNNNISNINVINNHEIMEQQIVSYDEATHNLVDNDIKLEENVTKYHLSNDKEAMICSTDKSFSIEAKKSLSNQCNSPMLVSSLSDSDGVIVSNESLNSIDNNMNMVNDVNNMVSSMDYCNMQTQVPSVPASPNTRRQAFNFQPISLRITPTIPENSAIGSYVNGNGTNVANSCSSSSSPSSSTVTTSETTGNSTGIGNNGQHQQHSPPAFSSNQRSIGVGLSQPPSSANSPFVSPRGTPIPLSRSRHDSGQSGYSGLRATPYPVIDSGLSSISSSPFISPQSTPVPLSGRMRTIGNCYSHLHSIHARSNLVNRARHSSGPGNPYTTLPSSLGGTFSMRSSSVSPMVVSYNANDLLFSSNGNNGQGATLASINAAFGETKHRTRNQSSTTTGTTTTSGVSSIGTPVSPKSEPLSPSGILISGDMSTSDLTSIDIASSSNGDSCFMDSCFTSRDWLTSNSRFLLSGYHGNHDANCGSNGLINGPNVGPVMRQRHFSSPYATIANNGSNNFSFNDSHSKEVQNLLKGSSFIES